MRTRRIVFTIAATVIGTGLIAGCTSNSATSGNSESAFVSDADTNQNPVEEAVTVPTEEIMPDDMPEGLKVKKAPPGENTMTDEEVMELYHIGPSDVLSFRSFDDETLNSTVTVRHDGMVSLPWIPDVKVGGLTRQAATEVVREAYQELYYEAEVSVQITEALSKTYTVTGAVARHGEFPYLKPITLLDAIVMAGGLRLNQRGGDSFVGGQGQLVKAFIFRGTGEDRTVTEYDLRHLDRGGSHDSQTPVLPGDVVFIPEGVNLVYVLGAVGRPGIQPLNEGMTLLQLIASVGGVNESIGRDRRVVLIREIDEEQTEVKLIDLRAMLRHGGDFQVQPGDIIFVPRKRLVTLGEFISRATGVVTPIIGVTSQAMGLYTQAFDAYYADERADLLYNSPQSNQLQTNLQLLESIRQIGVVADDFAGN